MAIVEPDGSLPGVRVLATGCWPGGLILVTTRSRCTSRIGTGSVVSSLACRSSHAIFAGSLRTHWNIPLVEATLVAGIVASETQSNELREDQLMARRIEPAIAASQPVAAI